jgi:hypothetical protein
VLQARHTEACVLACPRVCVHWHLLKMRHRGVNLQQEAAADPSSVLFGTSHDHLPPYMPPLSRPLSRRGSTGLTWPPRHTTAGSLGASLAPVVGSVVGSVVWTASRPETAQPSVAYPACRRIPSQDGERRGGCRESGVAEPRSPPPSNRTRAPRRKSWPLILALTRRPRPPLCCPPWADRDQARSLRAPSVAVTSGP